MWNVGHVTKSKATVVFLRRFELELEKCLFFLDEAMSSLGSSFNWEDLWFEKLKPHEERRKEE